uniref:Uncharacterized protein n=1 Tax=Timema shepardi TaxID=629360 RepID=A0A7R9BCI3_TIMSH|nr:unnamed protein product [Timema shepardi]
MVRYFNCSAVGTTHKSRTVSLTFERTT